MERVRAVRDFIKSRESALGFLAAADGALYAVRKDLFRELQSNEVHDLMHPIQVSLEGKRSVFVPDAFTLEPPSKDASVEFRRHVRIIAQGFLVFLSQAPRLLEKRKWKELFLLTSHRPLRWLSLVLSRGSSSSLVLVSSRPMRCLAFRSFLSRGVLGRSASGFRYAFVCSRFLLLLRRERRGSFRFLNSFPRPRCTPPGRHGSR
jgi:hypothetical protein